MSGTAVWARNLCKTYKVYARPAHRLVEALTRRPLHRRFEALAHVSFDVPVGQGLGIIGENGAGKSTLLKILSGVTSQTSGAVGVQGKIASILELGSGFHPEFTGRQNIRLNAAMLGLSNAEVEERMPDIVAFSELGSFLDQPVKTYSTGMAMRLGFSIATQVDPEVLIIDEALSVGDGYFQKKCMDRLLQFVGSGGTLLFCSHSMYYVSAFCRRALWLRNGRMAAFGETAEVVRDYETFLLRKGETRTEEASRDDGGGQARILEAGLGAPPCGTPAEFAHLDPWRLQIGWETDEPSLMFHIGVGIDRVDGTQVASFSTLKDGLPPFSGSSRYRIALELPQIPLIKGEFSVYVFLLDEFGLHPYDKKVLTGLFRIASDNFEIGLFEVEHRWRRDAPDDGVTTVGEPVTPWRRS